MVFAGMRSIVTKELFLTFARQIQQNGKRGNSEEQSKELILHLFKRPNIQAETAFLSEVSQINFISGYTVPQTILFIPANTINVFHSHLQNGSRGKSMGLHNFAHTEL
jgi:hypothetical protein